MTPTVPENTFDLLKWLRQRSSRDLFLLLQWYVLERGDNLETVKRLLEQLKDK